MQIDLNADMAEGFGPWEMTDDAGLLRVITSANIACGFHAGDPDRMMAAMRGAVASGVGIGAHPGFDDLRGFGRNRMDVPRATLENQIRYQVAAAAGMARAAGGRLAHVKLHGALANMASEDEALARACFTAALSVAPDARIMAMAATAQARAADALGVHWVGEIFADRAYRADGRLVDRRDPGAVIHDAGQAAAGVLAMLRAGAILPAAGDPIPTRIDTVCVHGDSPGAVAMAQGLRMALQGAGVGVARFG